MVLIMKESGTPRPNKDMVEVIKYGAMEAYTRDIGRVIKPTVVDDSFMLTVIFMMVTGKMIRIMDLVNTLTRMVLSTKVIGWTINNMAKARSIGLMAPNMKVSISTEKRMDTVSFCGLIDPVIVVSSSIIIFTAKELIHGLMEEFIMEIGSRTKCMEKEYSHGLTVVNMKVNTLMTRNKDMEFSIGQMVDSTMDTGCLESKKVLVFTSTLRVK